LSVVAWETTRRCPLKCQHCRGAARNVPYAGELSTAEGQRLLASIATRAQPILIFTGGEPMAREDIYVLARTATDLGLRAVMSPCGPLLTPETVRQLREAGIQRISISLDGATAATHDAFRGVPGIFDDALRGLRHAMAGGMEFQINCTVTKLNVGELPQIAELARQLGAATLDFFFLVPTGRGAELRDVEITPQEYEQALEWIARAAAKSPLRIKTTCAPHYVRVARRVWKETGAPPTRPGRPPAANGCMAARGFMFVSHTGELQPCGFFDRPCGNLRDHDMDFWKIYDSSAIFRDLRAPDDYHGKCGACEYRFSCGGCRARALAETGDYLDPEPGCAYVPGQDPPLPARPATHAASHPGARPHPA
jgi:radical SAM protein with 4Fe4S-binding SPASM domain